MLLTLFPICSCIFTEYWPFNYLTFGPLTAPPFSVCNTSSSYTKMLPTHTTRSVKLHPAHFHRKHRSTHTHRRRTQKVPVNLQNRTRGVLQWSRRGWTKGWGHHGWPDSPLGPAASNGPVCQALMGNNGCGGIREAGCGHWGPRWKYWGHIFWWLLASLDREKRSAGRALGVQWAMMLAKWGRRERSWWGITAWLCLVSVGWFLLLCLLFALKS